jgi:hypothetical protein
MLKNSSQDLQYEKLHSGQIITVAREDLELTDTSIALSMALYVKASYENVLKDIKKSANTLSDYEHALLIHIDDTQNLKPYIKKVVFTNEEIKEAKKLFDLNTKDKFNLSDNEIELLKKRTKNKDADINIASSFYQDVLEKRLKQYIKHGIQGIENYSHLKEDTSTIIGMEKSSSFLKTFQKFLPSLYDDYMDYPKTTSKNTKQNFFIIKDKLEDRPTFILKHQLSQEKKQMFIVAERQFYISHDLDAIQTQIICLPYKDGTLIALSSQSFTPKVSGFARGVAVKVGRRMMEKEILPMFESIRRKYN